MEGLASERRKPAKVPKEYQPPPLRNPQNASPSGPKILNIKGKKVNWFSNSAQTPDLQHDKNTER
jgi:hypothetical protein